MSQVSNRLNLLTPSLAKFFRADLITHVTNWPSEVLEKQVSYDRRLSCLCKFSFMLPLLGTKVRGGGVLAGRSRMQ